MPGTAPHIDMNAARREAQYPDGITVTIGAATLTLPAELPVEVLDPLLSEELGLVEAFSQVMSSREAKRQHALANGEDIDDDDIMGPILDALTMRPDLPRQTLQAVKDCFREAFGEEQYALYLQQRPSINDYLRLARALLPLYAVTLGEAFASPGSSVSVGATPKPTSTASTGSTPAKPASASRKAQQAPRKPEPEAPAEPDAPPVEGE